MCSKLSSLLAVLVSCMNTELAPQPIAHAATETETAEGKGTGEAVNTVPLARFEELETKVRVFPRPSEWRWLWRKVTVVLFFLTVERHGS